MNPFSFFTKTVGRKISLGYVLAVVLTVTIGAISYTSIGRLNETAELVDHTYLVLGQLEKITAGLIDAETGQRGFLITHLENYLEPYNTASTAVDKAIAEVRELTSDNPRQQARLDTLEPLVEAKRAELQQTIELRRNEGFEAAQAVVLTDEGKAVMDNIRDLIAEMSSEENDLLVVRNQDAQATSARSIFTILLITGLSMLFLTTIGFFTVRGIVAPVRELSEKSYQVAQGDLTARAEIMSSDEIGRLAGAFNTMVAQLQKAETMLVREKDRVEVELEEARAMIVSQTRLSTIGQVAASIAHDLRNPMTGINNAAYFLKEVAPETDTVQHKYLGLIRKEVGVASRIIDNLMSMTRLKESVKKRVDLAERVHDAFDSLEGKGDLRLQCKPERFEVHADPNQLRQVLINLLTNAAQAMDGTGLIVVEARHEERFDVITIADEGPGIPVEARDKIFEPLYTTKARGIGLGLFICRQIIERNGGMMDVVQTQAPGAVFRIRLPRADTQQTESITDGESANSGR